jgi:hypothetical protein
MMKLSTAVTMKFAEVFMMLTRTVEEARVRARVKRPHIMALKRRLHPKKSYGPSEYFVMKERDGVRGRRTPRIVYSTILLEALRPKASAIELDHDAVSVVVVLHIVRPRLCV